MSGLCNQCGSLVEHIYERNGRDLCTLCYDDEGDTDFDETGTIYADDFKELTAPLNAELARLRAELDQARVQLAGCLCAAEGTGDADKVKQGDYAWTPALQKTVELRDALAEAERERDDARRPDLICFVCEKPMRKDQAVNDQDIDNICPECASETISTLNYANLTLRAGAEAADDYYRALLERSRRTIRALVVAARVTRLAAVGFAFIAGVAPLRVHDEIRFGIKQAKQAERGQAGKE